MDDMLADVFISIKLGIERTYLAFFRLHVKDLELWAFDALSALIERSINRTVDNILIVPASLKILLNNIFDSLLS